MYLQHFGLKEAPFSLTPDPAFFFKHPGCQQALNVLLVALRTGEGFMKITGEVGTGKTLLCRRLLDALKDDFVTAYLPSPLLKPRQLHQAVAEELGVPVSRDASLQELLSRLTEKLIEIHSTGRGVVLCIDEAQTMPDLGLEALRLLSNLETEKRKLLHIVLFAQPELNTRLRQVSLRQLRQRITFSYDLQPLNRQGVAGYIAHRVKVAGHSGAPLFSPAAIKALSRASRGIPRLVNILSHKALLATYGRGGLRVGVRSVREAIKDTEDSTSQHGGQIKGRLVTVGAGGLFGAGLIALLYIVRGMWP